MSEQKQTADWTPPRVYRNPDRTPYRVAIYGERGKREVCEKRNPDAQDLANFELIARAPRIEQAAGELLGALVALRERGYFREHPVNDDARLTLAWVSLEQALKSAEIVTQREAVR